MDAGLASLGSGDTGFWAQLKAAAIKIAPAPSIMRFIGTSIRRDVFGVTASMTTPTASLPEIASSVGMVAVANLECQARQVLCGAEIFVGHSQTNRIGFYP